jgi:hypothetical protein
MDAEALTGMMLSSGMAKSREQAAAMADQMKSMSPGQMEMMKKAAKVGLLGGAGGVIGGGAPGLEGPGGWLGPGPPATGQPASPALVQ